MLQNFLKEQNRVRNQLQIELDKKMRENEEILRKFRKRKCSTQDHELKCFIAHQKKEYKFNKERVKNVNYFKSFFNKFYFF